MRSTATGCENFRLAILGSPRSLMLCRAYGRLCSQFARLRLQIVTLKRSETFGRCTLLLMSLPQLFALCLMARSMRRSVQPWRIVDSSAPLEELADRCVHDCPMRDGAHAPHA